MVAPVPILAVGDINLQELNVAQREAVHHVDGPCRVIAAAGSGKTKVLVARIAKLIQNGVPPASIVAVTFTKKAASEMQDRLSEIVNVNLAKQVIVGTFHSICYRILRESGQTITLCNPDNQRAILRDIFKKYEKQYKWEITIDEAVRFISWQKNHLCGPYDRLINVHAYLLSSLQKLYQLYEEAKGASGTLDYDDMLYLTYHILHSDSAVQQVYTEKYRYISVDEFQDTNVAQYEILKLLGSHGNVMVVGDPRQSIYRFRGADQLLDRFVEDWANAITIELEINYRSTDNIVRLSNHLLSYSELDYPNSCTAHRNGICDPSVLYADDEDHEAELIAKEIKELALSGIQYSEMAVLFRTNAQSRALEDALSSQRIPYTVVGEFSFYHRREVRDILAYLQLLEDPYDEQAIKRALNAPTRYLGTAFFDHVRSYASQNNISLLEALSRAPAAEVYQYRNVQKFLHLISELFVAAEMMTPSELLQEIRKRTRYEATILEAATSDTGDSISDNLDALVTGASHFATVKEFLQFIQQAADKVGKTETRKGNTVALMTIHRAKGMEFPVVFLTGLIQNILPHHKAFIAPDMASIKRNVEEERCLCYVAMTRAKDRLFLSTMEKYLSKPVEPSVFLTELLIYLRKSLA